MIDFFELKNGTDVRGTALGREEEITLTDTAVLQIAKAFCVWLSTVKGLKEPRIAIGHDSRLSAERIVNALTAGITECGCDVILTGLSSTPSMFMLLQDGLAEASVMVTASHLPREKNGLKFFVKEGGLESEELSAVLTIATGGACTNATHSGKITTADYIHTYASHLVQKVRTETGMEEPLKGLRILVDAGNGAGGFYESLVLKPLGADTTGSQFLEPDGNFPNHIPNPENEEAMRSVCDAVVRYNADFGIIFDTDVDRAGAVSPLGEEINRNRLIALISAIVLKEHPGATIVTDSVTSDGLTAFIRKRGGVHHRFKRGYKNVINESKRLNAEGICSPLAIETSGHAALAENYFLDDGAYLITRLLIALAKEGSLDELIFDLPEPSSAAEVRLPLPPSDFKKTGTHIIEELTSIIREGRLPYATLAPDNYEGVRINFDRGHGDGWVLVRLSLHEPILPINLESNQPHGTVILANELFELMSRFEGLDLTKLKKLITD